MIDAVFTIAIKGAFSLLFALAALEKLRDKEVFFAQLEQYKLIPKALNRFSGYLIISSELIAAILLVIPSASVGIVIGLALLTSYALAIGISVFNGRVWIDCGCLGSQGEGLSYWLVLRNVLLIAFLMVALIPETDRSFLWLDYLSIMFSIVAAVIAYSLINTLLAAHMRSHMWWSE